MLGRGPRGRLGRGVRGGVLEWLVEYVSMEMVRDSVLVSRLSSGFYLWFRLPQFYRFLIFDLRFQVLSVFESFPLFTLFDTLLNISRNKLPMRISRRQSPCSYGRKLWICVVDVVVLKIGKTGWWAGSAGF